MRGTRLKEQYVIDLNSDTQTVRLNNTDTVTYTKLTESQWRVEHYREYASPILTLRPYSGPWYRTYIDGVLQDAWVHMEQVERIKRDWATLKRRGLGNLEQLGRLLNTEPAVSATQSE